MSCNQSINYNANPRDLSSDSVSWNECEEILSEKVTDIFTQKSIDCIGLENRLVDVLKEKETKGGFELEFCTRVQSATIPKSIGSTENLLIKSQTGSGKTLSYLLPIFNDLMTIDPPVRRDIGTLALIIVPTRELATQICDVLERLSKACVRIVGGCITGGEKRKSEKARLRKGVVVLVGTPGRILDHIKFTESFNLSKLRWIVLDEVDRLLDMGFDKTVLEIFERLCGQEFAVSSSVQKLNPDNQKQSKSIQQKWKEQATAIAKRSLDPSLIRYVLVSATLTDAIKKLTWPIICTAKAPFVYIDGDSGRYFKVNNIEELDKVQVNFLHTPQNMATLPKKQDCVGAPSQLKQYHMMVTNKWRLPALLSFLNLRKSKKIVVFFSTCDSVDFHGLLLKNMEWPQELDMENASRDKAEDKKKNKKAVYLDPLEWCFNGVFGDATPIFRLHGKVPQHIRKAVQKEFSKISSGILLCTDVAARGLDLPRVDWIVQYDPPSETADYVHRIGRTARKGDNGNALLFLLSSEAMYLSLLSSHGLITTAISSQSMFIETVKLIPGAKKFKNQDDLCAVILQRRIENVIAKNSILEEAATQAYRSFIRAYATHSSDTKGIFQVKSLHLGHVAKSFGLINVPTKLNNDSDIIARIFNGDFRPQIRRSDKPERVGMENVAKIKIISTSTMKESCKTTVDKPNRKSQEIDEVDTCSSKVGKRALPSQNSVSNVALKKRKLSFGAAKVHKNLSASGKFRKTDGYFRKKLRKQSSSEFHSG